MTTPMESRKHERFIPQHERFIPRIPKQVECTLGQESCLAAEARAPPRAVGPGRRFHIHLRRRRPVRSIADRRTEQPYSVAGIERLPAPRSGSGRGGGGGGGGAPARPPRP